MDDDRSSSNALQVCQQTSTALNGLNDSPSFLSSSRNRIDEHVEDRNGHDASNAPSQFAFLGNSSGQKVSQCAPVFERSEELITTSVGRASLMRTCKLCGTTKTPLWRSGPQGPKSLCNACGIRFKKSRRSQGTEGFPDLRASTRSTPAYSKLTSRRMKRKLVTDEDKKAIKGRNHHQSSWPTWMVVRKSSISKVIESSNGPLPPRKRISHTLSASVRRKDSTAMLALSEKQGKITSVFAKDEEEAAILLMALSCGLVLA